MYDIANNVKAVTAIEPKANLGAANVTGDTIDRDGFESLAFAVAVGASGDTLSGSLKVDFAMQHALDDGAGAPASWEDCAESDVIAPEQSPLVDGTPASGVVLTIDSAAEDDTTYVVGYRGGRRFVRLNSAKTGTHTTGMPGGAVAFLGHPRQSPVT